jgi:KinB signaling pathway activation protein
MGLVQSREQEECKGRWPYLRLKNWLFLFFTTILVGAISATAISVFLQVTETGNQPVGEWLVGLIGFIGAGIMFSILSQMGFFAYLTVNYLALVLFRARWVWQTAQVLLTTFAFYDVIYLRQLYFGQDASGATRFWLLPTVLLGVAFIVAIIKVKQTNRDAWIPTIFFMFVVTLLEAVPSLKTDNARSILLMVTTIAACNAWQVLQLHRLVNRGSRLQQEKS